MEFALTVNRRRVHISHAKSDTDYYCPLCDNRLNLRQGVKRVKHFAHAKNTACTDRWHYEEGRWHTFWQAFFPADMREIIITNEYGKKHRADVLINKTTVVEFQHSPISYAEFRERNLFYIANGYNVVWLFDCIELFAKGNISFLKDSSNKFKWENPFPCLENFDVYDKRVQLYFQLDETVRGNDFATIVPVAWKTPEGFKRFASQSGTITGLEFVSQMYTRPGPYTPVSDNVLAHDKGLYDYFLQVKAENGELSYYGCPYAENLLQSYKRCYECKFCVSQPVKDDAGFVRCKCRARLADKNIRQEDILFVSRNLEGFVNSITFKSAENQQGSTQEFFLVPPMISTDVITLYMRHHFDVARLGNTRTGMIIQVSKFDLKNGYSSKYIYAKIKLHNSSVFSSVKKQVYDWIKDEWILLWYK